MNDTIRYNDLSLFIGSLIDRMDTEKVSVSVVCDLLYTQGVIGILFNEYNLDASYVHVDMLSDDIYIISIDTDFIVSVNPVCKTGKVYEFDCDTDEIYVLNDLPVGLINAMDAQNYAYELFEIDDFDSIDYDTLDPVTYDPGIDGVSISYDFMSDNPLKIIVDADMLGGE